MMEEVLCRGGTGPFVVAQSAIFEIITREFWEL